MTTGKVIWFNEFKGYGFVEDNKGNKYLAQSSSFKSANSGNSLREGQEVKFTPAKDAETPLSTGISGIAKQIEVI